MKTMAVVVGVVMALLTVVGCASKPVPVYKAATVHHDYKGERN